MINDFCAIITMSLIDYEKLKRSAELLSEENALLLKAVETLFGKDKCQLMDDYYAHEKRENKYQLHKLMAEGKL